MASERGHLLLDLPTEILLKIFQLLDDVTAVVHLGSTCSQLAAISKTESIWKRLLVTKFPQATHLLRGSDVEMKAADMERKGAAVERKSSVVVFIEYAFKITLKRNLFETYHDAVVSETVCKRRLDDLGCEWLFMATRFYSNTEVVRAVIGN